MSSFLALAALATSIQGVAAADAPNTCAGATTASALNTWLTETISSGTDIDWYRFNKPTAGFALLTLGDLAKNYKLHLYNSSCTLMAGSDRTGTQFEDIMASLPIGRYFLRVAPNSSTQFSTTAYALKFRTLNSGVQVLSNVAWTDTYGDLRIPGEIFNNTADKRTSVKITATYYNSANQVIGTGMTYTWQWTVAARKRAAFEIWDDKPAGFHHYKLTVSSSVTTVAPVAGLTLTAGVPYTETWGDRFYPGEVKNNNAFAVDVVVIQTLYTSRGAVYAANAAPTDPYIVDPGQTAPFELWADRWTGANRYVLTVDGVR